MVSIHTDLPKHRGEHEFAMSLKNSGYEGLQLWFSLDFIPGVRDVDLFLIEPEIGAFAIEIKAISLEMIEEISYRSWKISGRSPDSGPIQQAFSAGFGLRKFLESRVGNVPFIVATACFSKITRESWNKSFQGTDFGKEFSQRLLFIEDISSGPRVLAERLIHIKRNPPIRAGQRKDRQDDLFLWNTSEKTIVEIKAALDPSAKPKPTMTDYQRLQIIEKGVSDDLKKAFPVEEVNYGIFTGYPGTGKTFRLLQLLFSNAYQGKRVLYCCFNKTLSSDIRRLLNFSNVLKMVDKFPDTLDLFEIATQAFQKLGLDYKPQGHDEWLRLVVDELKQSRDEGLSNGYDLILIDEAQELNLPELELLLLQLNEGGSLFFAIGQGQELYEGKRKFGVEDAKSAFVSIDSSVEPKARALRRNFRNTKNVFLTAHLFYTTFPNVNDVEKKYLEISRKKGPQAEIEFDRPSGGNCELFFIDDSLLPTLDSPFYADDQEVLMSNAYYDFIVREYQNLTDHDAPIDLLVLVPSTSSVWTTWAKSALEQFRKIKGVDYADLTDDVHRRDVVETDQIRLCTFHSSRGLEGVRVLVFGFEQIENLAKKLNFDCKNLGFIVLSRSVFSTTLVLQNTSSRCRQLIEKIVYQVTQSI